MQPLTASPRQDLSEAAVRELLTCDSLDVAAGLDLLDTTGQVVDDLTDDLQSGSVSHDNRAAVHRSCRLSIQRNLDWSLARVRPYMVLSDDPINPTTTARFNLGVFILTSPDEERGELVEVNDDPTSEPELRLTYKVTGYDVVSLLQTGPADTRTAEAGAGLTYFQAIRDILTASETGLTILLDGTLQDTEIPATRVWAVFSPAPSWLRMITDLLAEIGYTAPTADENGVLRSGPFQDPASRTTEWTIDTADTAVSIIDPDRTLSQETGDIPNRWVFVGSNWPTTPVDGDGLYIVENLTEGAAAKERILRWVSKWVSLEAADHAALVAQGDKIVAGDKATVRTIDVQIDPLPIMGHDDVFTYADRGEVEKVMAASWTINLDGSRGQLQLGGAPREPLPVIEVQARATVTDDAPLRVVVDGATVDSFANSLNGTTYDVGDRVTVTIRNPLPPLVQGIES